MTVLAVVPGLAALACLVLAARRVPKGRRMLLLRRGKLAGIREAGFSMVIPFVDRMVEGRDGARSADCVVEGPEGAWVRLVAEFEIESLEKVAARLPDRLADFERAVRENAGQLLREEAKFALREETIDAMLAAKEDLEFRIYSCASDALARAGYAVLRVTILSFDLPAGVRAVIEQRATEERARRAPQPPRPRSDYETALAELEYADLTEEQKDSVRKVLKEKLGG